MANVNVLLSIVLLSFNLPIVAFLVGVPFTKSLSQALKEKSPTGESTGVTSYSRVTGALGAVILTALFWAVGNVLLTRSISESDIDKLAQLPDAFNHFFLIGSALFLPYAFNQLKTLFQWSANAGIAQADRPPKSAVPVSYGANEVTHITVVNLSTSINDADFQRVLKAVGDQVAQHFAPEWQHAATLSPSRLAPKGANAVIDDATDAVIYVGDQSDDTETGLGYAKGYHDQNQNGKPFGFVFLDICKLYNEPWSVTLSHEVLELLADPTATFSLQDPRPSATGGLQYALEVCDPTQGDYYSIAGVPVSNFVGRAFFCLPGGTGAINHLQLPQVPFVPRLNGYLQYQDATGAPQQIWGSGVTDLQKQAKEAYGPNRRNARRASRMAPR
uniref:hypothetical protein n=1 Tax=Burkholderia sp. AU33423 TaxID=2015355 RepID=UPI00117E3995|nr:hypothetical protein [Burkholderia sp. AU33423]